MKLLILDNNTLGEKLGPIIQMPINIKTLNMIVQITEHCMQH